MWITFEDISFVTYKSFSVRSTHTSASNIATTEIFAINYNCISLVSQPVQNIFQLLTKCKCCKVFSKCDNCRFLIICK